MAEPSRRPGPETNPNAAVLALAACGLAVWEAVQALPLSGHDDDWPGPGAGAAIAVTLGWALTTAALGLALTSCCAPARLELPWAALVLSTVVYLAIGGLGLAVGGRPFFGAPWTGDPRGWALGAVYLAPLVSAGIVLRKRLRSGERDRS